MTILERIKERAIELKLAAEAMIDDVEAAEKALLSVIGGLAAPAAQRKSRRAPVALVKSEPRAPATKREELSEREQQVKKLTDDGLEPKEIAKKLGVSAATVYSARDRYHKKLGI